MRIIDRYGQQNALPLSGTKPGTAASKGSAAGQGGATAQPITGENVTFSAKAKELADQSSAADAAKVDQLRSAVQNGTFKVDPRAIANKIVDGNEG
jgi:negative regulator of flagellin synthesis FlgM